MGICEPTMRRAVFLDRDGVVNRAVIRDGRPYPPASVEETEILPGVSEGIDALKRAGFAIAVVTNQPDVARGTQSREVVDGINNFLSSRLSIDRFEICLHDDVENCDCRKPKPGLILRAARILDVNPAGSFLVGDRWRDIEAGHAAGCRTIWLDYAYAEKRPVSYDYRAESLLEAARWIVAHCNQITTTGNSI